MKGTREGRGEEEEEEEESVIQRVLWRKGCVRCDVRVFLQGEGRQSMYTVEKRASESDSPRIRPTIDRQEEWMRGEGSATYKGKPSKVAESKRASGREDVKKGEVEWPRGVQ